MKKLNILHYFFLIPFTLLCVFVFNINSKALTAGRDANIKVGNSRTIDNKCTLDSGTAATVVSKTVPFGFKTTITCNEVGVVSVKCQMDSSNQHFKYSTITCFKEGTGTTIIEDPEESGEMGCEGILTADLVDLLQDVFNVIKFADVVLVLVLTIVTFTQAIAKGGDDLKKAVNITMKRVIIGVAIFFIPTLINFIFNAIGLYDTCGIG